MYRLIFAFVAMFTSLTMFATDVIVLRNGDIIEGAVTEVLTNEIKYKKASNPNGPTYSVTKSTVLSIRYENGEVDKFDEETPSFYENKMVPQIAQAAADNAACKEQYAVIPRLNIKSSNKIAKNFFPIMAFTDSSVISTNEIQVMMDPTAVMFYDGGWKVKMGYSILIVNKTNRPIYVDRANCFRKFNDLSTQCYYNGQQTNVSHGNSSSVGLGVGIGNIGLGFGGSSNSSYSENYGVDRFLAIGPNSKANLVDYEYIRLSEKKAKFKLITDIEYWGFNLNKNMVAPVREGEVKEYSETDTPYSNSYYITYATDKDFNNTYAVNFELYAKYIVGAKIKKDKWAMSLPNGDSGQNNAATSRMVSEIQNTIPDFWTNSLVIIGTCGGEYH